MDYETYLGIFAILHAACSLKELIWPDQLQGLKKENRRRYLKQASESHQLIDGTLYKQISFTKTIRPRSAEGEM